VSDLGLFFSWIGKSSEERFCGVIAVTCFVGVLFLVLQPPALDAPFSPFSALLGEQRTDSALFERAWKI